MLNSIKSIADACSIDRSTVRRRLKELGVSVADLQTTPELGKFIIAYIDPKALIKLHLEHVNLLNRLNIQSPNDEDIKSKLDYLQEQINDMHASIKGI